MLEPAARHPAGEIVDVPDGKLTQARRQEVILPIVGNPEGPLKIYPQARLGVHLGKSKNQTIIT
jgi:hypothetical protein